MSRSTRVSRRASCLLLVAGAGACVSATFVPTGGAVTPRPVDCEIQVFSSAVPERAYEELGIVEGEGSWWKSNLEDVLPKLKEEACLAGGDAIIMESSDTFAEGEDGIRVQRITATVIRWKGP